MKHFILPIFALFLFVGQACTPDYGPLEVPASVKDRGFNDAENQLKGTEWKLDTFTLASLNGFILKIDSVEDAEEKSRMWEEVNLRIERMRDNSLFTLKEDRSCQMTIQLESTPSDAEGVWWVNDAGNLSMINLRKRDTFEIEVLELSATQLTLKSGEEDELVQYWIRK